MRSKRETKLPPETPGVGRYDLLYKPPKPFDVYLDKIRCYNRMIAKSLRTLEKEERVLQYFVSNGHLEKS